MTFRLRYFVETARHGNKRVPDGFWISDEEWEHIGKTNRFSYGATLELYRLLRVEELPPPEGARLMFKEKDIRALAADYKRGRWQ